MCRAKPLDNEVSILIAPSSPHPVFTRSGTGFEYFSEGNSFTVMSYWQEHSFSCSGSSLDGADNTLMHVRMEGAGNKLVLACK